MRRVAVVLLLAGSLAGCSGSAVEESPWLTQGNLGTPRLCEALPDDQELVLEMSRDMAGAGRLHAALANLERLPNETPQVRLNKARLLRLLGRSDESEQLYRGLLNSCLVADANHGLGQLEAARNQFSKAQGYLRIAASLSPANEAIRNDLGVVYMNQRRLPEARFELLTAMELEENSQRAALNMLTLLLYEDNWQAARELVASRQLSSTDFSRAEQRARGMRHADAKNQEPAIAEQVPAADEPAPAAVTFPAAMTAAVQARAGAADVAPAAVADTPPPAVAKPAAVAAPATEAAEQGSSTARTAAGPAKPEAADARAADSKGDVQPPSVQPVVPASGARQIVCRSTGLDSARLSVMECLPE